MGEVCIYHPDVGPLTTFIYPTCIIALYKSPSMPLSFGSYFLPPLQSACPDTQPSLESPAEYFPSQSLASYLLCLRDLNDCSHSTYCT